MVLHEKLRDTMLHDAYTLPILEMVEIGKQSLELG